jgi:ParB family chromosome partitioning protein
MWDILRFLKNPEGDNLKDSSSNPSADAEKRQINEQLAGALERAVLAIDKVLSKREAAGESSSGTGDGDFLTQGGDVPDSAEDDVPVKPEERVPAEADVRPSEEAARADAEVNAEAKESGPRVRTAVEADDVLESVAAPAVAPHLEETGESNGGRLIVAAISSVRPNPFQPRRTMGEAELQELAQSVREFGVLQPILVKSVAGGYELIAGERRLRAASLAGLSEIPAMVVETEPVAQQIIALVENIQRKNLSAIEEAACLNDILSKTGWSQTELSSRMGRSQASIANKLRLLRLDSSVQDLVISGKLGERQARSLLSLSAEEQKQLAQRAIDEELSTRALEQLVENWNNRERAQRTKAKKNSQDGPADELLGDIASVVNRHKNRGVSAQWKVKRMNQDSLVVEIIVDLTGEGTAAAEEATA